MWKKPKSPEQLKNTAVKALRCPAGSTRKEYSIGQGLSIEVRAPSSEDAPHGKTWIYRYRSASGKGRSLRLGTYPTTGVKTALRRFRELRLRVEDGEDPWLQARQEKLESRQRLQETEIVTVGQLVEDYLRSYARPNKRSWLQDKLYLRRDVVGDESCLKKGDKRYLGRGALGDWKNRPIQEITRDDVETVLERVRSRGAKRGADQLLAIMRKMFNWAVSKKMLKFSPCDGVERQLSVKGQSRDRYLTAEEIALAIPSMQPPALPRRVCEVLLFQLFTGQRVGEVSRMEWSEIDFEEATWTIPKMKAKNKHTHLVPLSTPALEILRRQPRRIGSKWVFPTLNGDKPINRHYISNTLRKFLRAELPEANAFTPHDLRRTAYTHMAKNKVRPHVIARVVNHSTGNLMEYTYNRYDYFDEKREALEMWATKLQELLGLESPAQDVG